MPTRPAIPVVAYYPLPPGQRRQALADQTRATSAFARERGLVVLEPFVESRRGHARPELERALACCHEGGASLLVPRLAVVGGDLDFLERVLRARVPLLAADRGRAGAPTLRLLREVALHTRSEASHRSRAALRAARARGVALGSPRPEVGSRAAAAALRARAESRAREIAPVLAELILSNPGASLRSLAQLLEAQDVPTPRRGRWGPSGVRNAIERSGLALLRAKGGARAARPRR